MVNDALDRRATDTNTDGKIATAVGSGALG